MRSPSTLFPITLALLLGLGVAAAAQSSIVLQNGDGQTVTFSGEGAGTNDIGVSLGSCNSQGACTLTGTAAGSNALESSGAFTLSSTANTITLTSNGNGGYSASASAPIDFSLTGSVNGQIGTLLSGTLNLLNFVQSAGSNQGSFNTNVAANLGITGGLLANVFTAAGGELVLNVTLPTSASLSALAGTSLSVLASLSASGAGSISPTPEPSSLALLGGGLLLLLGGGWYRRRGGQALATVAPRLDTSYGRLADIGSQALALAHRPGLAGIRASR